MVDSILITLGIDDCSTVTSAQLAGIAAFSVGSASLTSLRSGDFDGLPSLILLHLNDNSLAALPPDVFDGLSNLQQLRLDNNSLTCIHPGLFDGLSELWLLDLSGNHLGNITPALPDLFPWNMDKLTTLGLGDTLIGESAVDFAAYKAVLPALNANNTYVRDTAELSVPVCGAITADMDGAYHGTVRVWLDGTSVRPNRARASDAALLGDGVCGSDPAATQHVLWTWQRSADGVSWTDAPNQPKAYGVRAEGECSFTYTPQPDDDGMYIRAYVPVNTAGVGRHDYHTAAFGPLNLRP